MDGEGQDRSCRILVVDDEQSILELFRDVLCSSQSATSGELQRLGQTLFGDSPASARETAFELQTCRSGVEAVRAVREALDREKPFAAAFIDVRMPPGLDGVAAAERIRALDPDLAIVIVTGYSDVPTEEIVSRVLPPEKLLFLQKPLHNSEIRQLAESLGAQWRADRESQTDSMCWSPISQCRELRARS